MFSKLHRNLHCVILRLIQTWFIRTFFYLVLFIETKGDPRVFSSAYKEEIHGTPMSELRTLWRFRSQGAHGTGPKLGTTLYARNTLQTQTPMTVFSRKDFFLRKPQSELQQTTKLELARLKTAAHLNSCGIQMPERLSDNELVQLKASVHSWRMETDKKEEAHKGSPMQERKSVW